MGRRWGTPASTLSIAPTTAWNRRVHGGQASQLGADRLHRPERPPGDLGLALERLRQGLPGQLGDLGEHLAAQARQGGGQAAVRHHRRIRRAEAHRLDGEPQPAADVGGRRPGVPDQRLPLWRLLVGPSGQPAVVASQERRAGGFVLLLQAGQPVQQPLGLGGGYGVAAQEPGAHRQTVAVGGAAQRGKRPQRRRVDQLLVPQRDQALRGQSRPVQPEVLGGQTLAAAPAGDVEMDEHQPVGQSIEGLGVHEGLPMIPPRRTPPAPEGRIVRRPPRTGMRRFKESVQRTR